MTYHYVLKSMYTEIYCIFLCKLWVLQGVMNMLFWFSCLFKFNTFDLIFLIQKAKMEPGKALDVQFLVQTIKKVWTKLFQFQVDWFAQARYSNKLKSRWFPENVFHLFCLWKVVVCGSCNDYFPVKFRTSYIDSNHLSPLC